MSVVCRLSLIALLTFAFTLASDTPAAAEMYTVSGHVRCGYVAGIANETVLVRYVYQFEGEVPHEGRVYCTTGGADGIFQVDRDNTNIRGTGQLTSVVAWAWHRDGERYIDDVTLNGLNVFDDFVYACGRPDDIRPEENGRLPRLHAVLDGCDGLAPAHLALGRHQGLVPLGALSRDCG